MAHKKAGGRTKNGRESESKRLGLKKFGRDAIIPGRFLTMYDPKELAKHAFEGTRDEYAKHVKAGDIIVGGKNFGCGSSREHAPLAFMGGGVRVVVAQSFARIFLPEFDKCRSAARNL